jgi:sulfite exporter TauE/SafE
MFLWTAFLIGLVGSFHCAGMCGPIALALPLQNGRWIVKIAGGLIYNSGRIITYMILGALFGLLGKGISLAGFQLWSSMIIGILMIVMILVPILFGGKFTVERLFGGYSGRLYSKFNRLFHAGTRQSLFGIGLLNGILPCGLVYVAIAGALNTGEVVNSMVFMALFGFGTIPVMLSVALAGNFISLKVRNLIGKLTPYLVITLGVLFILRGLSLGIPYISPKAEALTPVVEKAHKCCHK